MIHEGHKDTRKKDLSAPSCSSWMYSLDHGQVCQVIEIQTLLGETTYRVWLSGHDSVVRIPASSLMKLDSVVTGSPHGIAYVAAARLYPEMPSLLMACVKGDGHE